jgi:Mg-chelatase subunit ChlD
MVNEQILMKAQDNTRRNQHAGERVIPQIVILLTDGESNDPDTDSLKREADRIKKDIEGSFLTVPFYTFLSL